MQLLGKEGLSDVEMLNKLALLVSVEEAKYLLFLFYKEFTSA